MTSRAAEYRYPFPHPAVTTDILVFGVRNRTLVVLLVKRGSEPYKGAWALPGGFLDIEEDLEGCALRELAEETGITGLRLEQLSAFGKPQRDPRERVISIAYYALADLARLTLRSGSDATDADWFETRRLPPLAFDHGDVIAMAQQRLLSVLVSTPLASRVAPDHWTLADLRELRDILRADGPVAG